MLSHLVAFLIYLPAPPACSSCLLLLSDPPACSSCRPLHDGLLTGRGWRLPTRTLRLDVPGPCANRRTLHLPRSARRRRNRRLSSRSAMLRRRRLEAAAQLRPTEALPGRPPEAAPDVRLEAEQDIFGSGRRKQTGRRSPASGPVPGGFADATPSKWIERAAAVQVGAGQVASLAVQTRLAAEPSTADLAGSSLASCVGRLPKAGWRGRRSQLRLLP